MPSYDANHLRQLQQYRAVTERIPKPRSQLLDESVLALSQGGVDALIDHLDPTVETPESAPPAVQTVIDEIDRDRQQVIEARLKRIATQSSVTPFETVTATELAFGFSQATLTDARLVNAAGVGVAYQSLKGLLDEQGLALDDVVPTHTLDRPVATDDGDPLAPSGLQTLPDYFADGPIRAEDEDTDDSAQSPDASNQAAAAESAAGHNTLSESDLPDRAVTPGEQQTVRDLMESAHDPAETLRHQLKYVRDCLFLRVTYDRVTDWIGSTDCPQLVWKHAALDIADGTDPFATLSADPDTDAPIPDTDNKDSQADDITAPTEHLFDTRQLPEHLSPDETAATETESEAQSQQSDTAGAAADSDDPGTQTGLSQF